MKHMLFFLAAAALLVGCVQGGLQPASPETPAATPQSSPTPGGGPDMNTPVYPDPDRPTSNEPGSQTPGETPASDPLLPVEGEEDLVRGEAFIDSVDALILESYPPQVMINLKGSLPTPCHQLRASLARADDQKRIQLEVYSLVDPDTVCIQMIKPFETNISLGSFEEAGTYSVFVNGEQMAEFTIP